MATRAHTFTRVEGLWRTLNALPKAAQRLLRAESRGIAADVAVRAAGRARSVGGVMAHVAPTVRASSDRVPKVVMGGTGMLPAHGGRPRRGDNQTVGNVVWGAEFGSLRHKQFSPWRGNGDDAGYALWPVAREMAPETMDRYLDALATAVDVTAGRFDG